MESSSISESGSDLGERLDTDRKLRAAFLQRWKPALPRRSVRAKPATTLLGLFPVVFLLAHVPLTLVMRTSSGLATAHALLTFGVGVVLVLFSRGTEKLAYWAAYVAGVEVLWRMTKAQTYWEVGKYSVVAVILLFFLRHGLKRAPWKPLAYFAMLTPGALVTLTSVEPAVARNLISFNLSGPFSLLLCAAFFSRIRLTKSQVYHALLYLMAPIMGILFCASYAVATADKLAFSKSSNFVASGGFGPNQVSAMLGLGVLAGVLILFEPGVRRWVKILLLVVVCAMLGQSALTFSRTGVYLAALSVAAALVFQIRDSSKRIQHMVLFLGLFAVAVAILWPRLDAFTGGTLSARFENSKTTGRTELAEADLQIWKEHPVFGIGVGLAQERRNQLIAKDLASHTEFTRLLAEHGLLGLLATALLLLMAWENLRRARGAAAQGIVAAAIVWTFAFMLVSGMRLLAPSLVFGLTFSLLNWQTNPLRSAARPMPARPILGPVPVPHPLNQAG